MTRDSLPAVNAGAKPTCTSPAPTMNPPAAAAQRQQRLPLELVR